MVKDFFAKKREWSKYKDMILGYYLTPYLPKVCSMGRPVVIVDCFAGKGRFDDGTDGSPRIIAQAIKVWADKGKQVEALVAEERKALFCQLEENVREFGSLCRPVHQEFEKTIADINRLARTHSVFVYIDPYGLKPLKFSLLASIYRHLDSGTSVEVLMNFHAPSLVRNGRAALGLTKKETSDNDEGDDSEDEVKNTMSPEEVDEIAGGDYWRKIVSSDLAFSEMEQACVHEYMKCMAQFFKGVCCYPVKEKYAHKVPKYWLLFGSRYPGALVLINDAVCRARDRFLKKECVDNMLFDTRKKDEWHDPARLQQAMLTVLGATPRLQRRDLIVRSLESVFGEYLEKEHRYAIYELLKRDALYSASGKKKFNDTEWLSRQPFTGGKRT